MSLPGPFDLIAHLAGLLPGTLPADPMPILAAWFEEARKAAKVPNPDAVTLSTASPQGRPSARIVLCRHIDTSRGALDLFTNYQSRKGCELEANPFAALTFHDDHAHRQARVEGPVVRVPDAESDAYFATRPLLSQIGAWASEQSRPLAERGELVNRVRAAMTRFNVSAIELAVGRSSSTVPRPPHWGGYRLWAERVELWVQSHGRLHDRAEWVRQVDARTTDASAHSSDAWEHRRLFP